MNSRERTFLALDFEPPDRTPRDLWISSGFRRKLEAATGMSAGEFREFHDVDLWYIEGPTYVGPPLRTFPDGSDEDIWGVRRTTVTVTVGGGSETYREVAVSPLASMKTVEEIQEYSHWPSPDWFDYSLIEAQCDEIRNRGRVAVFMGDRLNRIAQLKPAMYLRSMEQILMDMSLNPEIAIAIFERIRTFYYGYEERIFDAANGKLDILLTGDDFGTQRAPLISPRMWADFIGEGFARFVSIAQSHGTRVMHHTCGSVRPIIPLMMDRGLEVLQSLQPEASGMVPEKMKAEYGDHLAFHGGISIQQTMPYGSRDDIRREVKERVESLGNGGGYILCTAHNIQADTSVGNVQALLEAYKDFGA